MKLENIRVVLVATSHPGNIGSTARAMKTMGLNKLYLVTPKSFPDQRANEMAAGADDVLDNAIITSSLQEALVGCHLILATSARPRGMGLPGLIPVESAALASTIPDDQEIALIFGREHAGLTNEELMHSHYHINIPSNPDYSSLNLSQAVQIVAYEMRMKLLAPKPEFELKQDKLATADATENFLTHLKEVLIEINFLKLTNPRRLMQRIRRMFNRIKLEEMEVNLLRGMLTQIQNALTMARKK